MRQSGLWRQTLSQAHTADEWWIMDKKQNIRTTEKVIGGTVYIIESVVSENAKETVEAKVKRLILSNLKLPTLTEESYQLDKET